MFSHKLNFHGTEIEGGFGTDVFYLESKFQSFSGKTHNIAVSSATAAADMIFSWLSPIKIHVPTLTFCSPAMMALKNGHTVVIEDVNFSLQQYKFGELNMPVMYGGATPSDEHCLVLDAAHNPCSCHVNSNYAFTSFYPTKPLRCLNGGMISTNNDEAADYFFRYRNFGRFVSGGSYRIEQAGNKYYLDKFNAHLVLEQIDNYQATVDRRRANFEYLRDNVKCGFFAHHDEHSSYYFASLILRDIPVQLAKDKIKEKTGITCSLHYPLLHQQPFFKEHPNVRIKPCPNAEQVLPRLLNLPLAEYHPHSLYEDIVKCLRSL